MLMPPFEKVTIDDDHRFALYYLKKTRNTSLESLEKAWLQFDDASELRLLKYFHESGAAYDSVSVEVDAGVLDEMAISWIRARKLQYTIEPGSQPS